LTSFLSACVPYAIVRSLYVSFYLRTYSFSPNRVLFSRPSFFLLFVPRPYPLSCLKLTHSGRSL
jgi:hypothetical protein